MSVKKHVVDAVFAEYGQPHDGDPVGAAYIPRLIEEFVGLTKQAMREGEDHIIVPTSLAMLLACFLDTRILPQMKE